MTTINIQQIRDELCQFLRLSDVLSTAVRGVTRTTSTYTVGVGGEAAHTFTGNIPVRDFKSLTVDAAAKYYLRDYTMNWNTGVLTWNSALTNGQVVVYQIDWSASDKIFPDFPRDDLTLGLSFPRVGLELVSISTVPLGLGGANHISDLMFTIQVVAPANKDTSVSSGYGGLSDLEETMRLIRAVIRASAKSFYTFQWIYPLGLGPLFKGLPYNKTISQGADYRIRFLVE